MCLMDEAMVVCRIPRGDDDGRDTHIMMHRERQCLRQRTEGNGWRAISALLSGFSAAYSYYVIEPAAAVSRAGSNGTAIRLLQGRPTRAQVTKTHGPYRSPPHFTTAFWSLMFVP